MKSKLKRTGAQFDFTTECFLCGHKLHKERQLTERKKKTLQLLSTNFQVELLNYCENRNDDLGTKIRSRITDNDLIGLKAKYHISCYNSLKAIDNPGRPLNKNLASSFEKLCQYIEESNEYQFSLAELKLKFKDLLENGESDVYSDIYMKKLLLNHFKERISVKNVDGKGWFFIIKDEALHSIFDCMESNSNCSVDERDIKIIKAAALIIKNVQR